MSWRVGHFSLGKVRWLVRRGVAAGATVLLAGAGAVIFSSMPASAAPSTDSVYVYVYPTNIVEPLPAGTPDVATTLASVLTQSCGIIGPAASTYELAVLTGGEVIVCQNEVPKPVVFIVTQVGPLGLALPHGFGSSPGCGVEVFEFPGADGSTTAIGLAPPGATC